MDGNVMVNIDIELEGEAQLAVKLPEILKALEEKSMNSSQLIEAFELKITSSLLVSKLKKVPEINVTNRNKSLLFDAKKDKMYIV